MSTTSTLDRRTLGALRSERRRRARRYLMLYGFCVIPVAALLVFHYIPIYGILLAFKDFKYNLGILGSPWNDFQHFRDLFTDPFFPRIVRNSIIISVLKIIFAFPAPILLAILINEIRTSSLKRTIQSISYLPHFMSWVVLAGIIEELLSPQRGLPLFFATLFGADRVPDLLADPEFFRAMLVMTHIWQAIGWGSIIYFAAISNIDPELYEVAALDGAGRVRIAWHITVPSLVPVITVVFILQIGRLLSAGFDQIFNLYHPLVYEVADILDTYEYRVGIVRGEFGIGTAVGLFKNVIGVTLLVGANLIIKRYNQYGIW
jgi:putative aldouronate transport system permease protein